jgi:hypothetical protein
MSKRSLVMAVSPVAGRAIAASWGQGDRAGKPADQTPRLGAPRSGAELHDTGISLPGEEVSRVERPASPVNVPRERTPPRTAKVETTQWNGATAGLASIFTRGQFTITLVLAGLPTCSCRVDRAEIGRRAIM